MEARTLARCLHSRPALYSQATLLRGQSIASNTRYYSTPASPNRPNRPIKIAHKQSPRAREQAARSSTSDIDQILNKLDLNSKKLADTTEKFSGEGTPAPKPQTPRQNRSLDLSRAVGQSAETDNYRQPVRRVELKLGPTLGRQVHVEPERGLDLPSALRVLGAQCNANQIKRQEREQKFHVRRGQLKKNVRMMRWRKLFKFSFEKTVNKIQRMRAQGW